MRDPDQRNGSLYTPSIDVLLRFDGQTQAIYEKETSADRVRHLQLTIIIGLIFYNMFNLSSVFLMPDILWMSVMMRALLVTLGSLVLVWLIPRVSSRQREWLVCLGMIKACAVPIFLFWYSQAELSAYSFLELPLSMVFGALVLSLRFRFVLFKMAVVALMGFAALTLKADMSEALKFALGLQLVTATAFVITANYLAERQRCVDYVRTLLALREATTAQLRSESLSQLSMTDDLTGLPNRRSFDELAPEFLRAYHRVAILMCDVDYFKLYNDTKGHIEGDRCLEQVAGALAASALAQRGLVARLGGEEFCALIPVENELSARRACALINRAVEDLRMPHPGRPDQSRTVTISVGLAINDMSAARPLGALMTAADDALYLAKLRGRNTYAIEGTARGEDAQRKGA